MTTISIAAQKGGVGKTSTAISISAYLAKKGFKVLLIDIDAQGNASQVLLDDYSTLPPEQTVAVMLLENKELVYFPSSRISNLYVCPSHDQLSIAESLLSTLLAKERRLEMQLQPVKDKFDFVIIDCPPNVNDLPKNAMVASDYILVPFQADTFNLRGLRLLLEEKAKINKYFNPKLDILGLLSVAYDQRKAISKDIYNGLVSQFGEFSKGGKVFKTKLPVNAAITYAHANRKDIFDYELRSPISMAYSTLIEDEILPFILNINA